MKRKKCLTEEWLMEDEIMKIVYFDDSKIKVLENQILRLLQKIMISYKCIT